MCEHARLTCQIHFHDILSLITSGKIINSMVFQMSTRFVVLFLIINLYVISDNQQQQHTNDTTIIHEYRHAMLALHSSAQLAKGHL
jgi:hypothetical protein